MTGQPIGQLVLWLILAVIVIFIFVLYWVMHWLYRRSTKEVAFVRTGFLGEKVVIDGGAFVWPIVHDITPVNMNSLQLGLTREKDEALITRDRMRIDVDAEFHVRVRQSRDAVSPAAATLGRRTLEPERLHALLSGKFVSALRNIASQMTMEELHEHRDDYVRRVREAAQAGLDANGLELESVAITDIDQTDLEYFNPSNRFDAEGLTEVIKEVEARRKLRNDIEQESMIAIRTRNLEAEKQALEIERESEWARLEQEREVEFRRAQQRAELARERAERETDSERARIAAREQIETARIADERMISEARIESEREVRHREIEREQMVSSAEISPHEQIEKARIAQARALADARFETEADKIRRAVEAEAQRLLNEAENVLSDDARFNLFRRKLLEHVEGIVSASVRPLEKIKDIRIMQLGGNGSSGLGWADGQGKGGGTGGGTGGGGGGGGSPTDEVINSALRYRVQAPMIDSLLSDIGIDGSNIARQGGLIREASDMQRIAAELRRSAPGGGGAPEKR